MSPSATPDSDHSVATDQIPTLTQDMVVPLVPQAVSLALDAREAEKKALMALSEELVKNLRPEIDRLTADLVQRTLQGVWDQRARIYQDA